MAEQLKWGILGNANIARVCVIPAIQKSTNSTVHALATRSPDAAGQVVAENKIPHIYDNYDKLLTDPEIQIVYIPLPNHLHHPWTLKALKAGKHVLCEKPLACNADQAREMVDAARESGLLLMEAFMYRFHPRSRRIKEMVVKGSIGIPCLMRSAFCFHMDDQLLSVGEGARLKQEMGGGALLDVGCYSVSMARWLFGEEPTRVQGQAVYHPGGVDIHFVGSLRFADDGLATMEASFISALQQTFTVVGSTAAIELPHNAFVPWEMDATFVVRARDEAQGTEHVIPGANQYRLMVEHFAGAVFGKTPLAYAPDESVLNMKVLDALAQAAQSGRTIDL
ncbi:MAG: Gfo/Idh/MocA family oxidoreductase [Desulfobacterales bacterium]|jgi:predicted dehydrogenase